MNWIAERFFQPEFFLVVALLTTLGAFLGCKDAKDDLVGVLLLLGGFNAALIMLATAAIIWHLQGNI